MAWSATFLSSTLDSAVPMASRALSLAGDSVLRLLAQADAGVPAAPVGGGEAPGGGGGAAGGILQIVMFAGIFAVFYFLVLRPQQKRAKTHKAFIDSLAVGSRVVTTGGLFGKIVALEGNECKLEIADRVVIRILRSQIAGLETNAAEAVANLTAR